MTCARKLTIGIDASNLRLGGGITHLVELLRAAVPESYGVDRVVVWGGQHILDELDNQVWLHKSNPSALDKGLLQRIYWQQYYLSQAARDAGCHILFVPGGSYIGNFRPVVTMSRNMLPFEWRELKRYGLSLLSIKLLFLHFVQSRSFKKADGVIFLTEYARKAIINVVGLLQAKTVIIPHGLNLRFANYPKIQRAIDTYSEVNPYRVLYVSRIDQYKHQWVVVEAIELLRREGLPIVLDLVGSAYPPALKHLNKTIKILTFKHTWVHYYGPIPYNELNSYYEQADLGLFASSCENMPNILLEKMASGLPIVSSNKGPMPEILGKGGMYFDPEQPADIARALRKTIDSPQLRTKLTKISYELSHKYSWSRCAADTFQFLTAGIIEK